MDSILERRMLLRGAGVAGASMVGVAAVTESASAHGGGGGDHGHRLLGAWKLTHTDDPPSGDTGLAIVAFSAGGVLSVEEIPDGSLGLGAWRSEGDHFRAHFFESAPGDASNPGVVVEVRVRGRVHDDKLSGTYRVSVRSAKDDSVLDTLTGTFHAHRVRA
jgi:hypothetical protein